MWSEEERQVLKGTSLEVSHQTGLAEPMERWCVYLEDCERILSAFPRLP